MRKHMTILACAAVFAAACASLPVKEQAVHSLQGTHAVLSTVQDSERALCNPAVAAQRPQVPITACDGDTATKIGLGTAQHQALSALLAKSFDAEGRAAAALQAWKAGDPAPQNLAELVGDVHQVLDYVKQVNKDPRVGTLVTQLQDAVDALVKLQAAFAAGK